MTRDALNPAIIVTGPMLSVKEQVEKYPVIAECFERYTRYRTPILVPNFPTGMGPMRAMPVGSAIKNDSHAATYDEVEHIIERAWAISVGPCSCRRTRRLMGEGCGHLEDDMCMYIDDNAKFFSQQGSHRLVSKEEALEILKRAEDNGLVHEINAAEGYDGPTAICNCCGCSCLALRLGEYFNAPDMLRTNYVAKVDRDKCVACGLCVDNCQMGALKLGAAHVTAVDIDSNAAAIAERNLARNAAAPLYLRPQALEPGYVRTRSEPRYIGVPGELAGYAQRLRFVDGPLEAAPGVWLLPHDTPGLARRGRAVSMYRETAAGAVDDDFSHEQSLIFVTDDGLVLFSSCSHAGADTVVDEARRFFPGRPVRAFLGGFHLMGHGGVTTLGAPPAAVEALGRRLLELGVEEVMVIGHNDCGVAHINADMMIRHLIQRGISQDHIDMMRYCGVDFAAWLRGFDCVENSVAETVELLRNHPLMPADVTIRGYIINTETGELTPQD